MTTSTSSSQPVLIGYTRGPKPSPASRQAADDEQRVEAALSPLGCRLFGWHHRDPGSGSDQQGPEKLLRLQQCVFLVRARFLDGVYVHNHDDIPDIHWPTVAAEVMQVGGILVVEDQRIRSIQQISCIDEETVNSVANTKAEGLAASERDAFAGRARLAELGAVIRDFSDSITSGTTEDFPERIGVMDSKEGQARLVDKLRKELNWTQDCCARLLEEAEYTHPKHDVPFFTGRYVGGLQRQADNSLDLARHRYFDQAWFREPVRRSPDGWTLTFGSPAHAESRPLQRRDGIVESESPGLPEPTPIGSRLHWEEHRSLAAALGFIRCVPFFDGLCRAVRVSTRVLSAPLLEVILGESCAWGAEVFVDGDLVPASQAEDDDQNELRRVALSAARFHRALLNHDDYTFVQDRDTLARTVLMEAEGSAHSEGRRLSNRVFAKALNEAGVPTLSGRGCWGHSQAGKYRKFLQA